MKKLMFGVFAALAAGSVFAEQYDPYLFEGCDLVTYPYLDTCDQWYLFSNQGVTREWTISSDFTKNIVQWRSFSPDWAGGASSTLVMNFNQHTYTVPSYLCILAFGEKGTDSARAYLTAKNGTFNGAEKANLQIGQDTKEFHSNGTYTFENVTFNFNAIYCGRGLDNSEVIFKNSTVTAPNFYFSDVNYNDEVGLTVTFENTKLNITNGDLSTGVAGGISDLTMDVGRKHIFTGANTVVTAKGSFSACQQLPYVDTLITDGAEVHTQQGIYWGISGNTGHHGTITVENGGYLNADWGLYFGWNSGHHTMTIRDGGKLKANELDIGRYTDNNTLIISNADISACGGICVGGYPGATNGCPKANRVYLYGNASEGKDNSYNGSPLNGKIFYGRNGLLYMNNTVVQKDEALQFNPINSEAGEDESQEWTGNTLFLDNGAVLPATDFQMGSFHNAAEEALKQNLIIGNNALLDVRGQFMNSGYGNTITVSNGTLRTGGKYGFYVAYSTENDTPFVVGNNKLILQGDHPRIETTADSSDAYIYNDTVLRFDLPDDGEYKAVPIEENSLVIDHDVAIEFGNLDQVRENVIGTKEIPLIKTHVWFNNPEDTIANANEKLPSGCLLHYEPDEGAGCGTVYLRVKSSTPEKPGAVLIIK